MLRPYLAPASTLTLPQRSFFIYYKCNTYNITIVIVKCQVKDEKTLFRLTSYV